MQERSTYGVFLNIKLVRIFSSGAYLGEIELEKSAITLKYATDAERIYVLWGGLDKARHIVPTALLVGVQCFRKGM